MGAKNSVTVEVDGRSPGTALVTHVRVVSFTTAEGKRAPGNRGVEQDSGRVEEERKPEPVRVRARATPPLPPKAEEAVEKEKEEVTVRGGALARAGRGGEDQVLPPSLDRATRT